MPRKTKAADVITGEVSVEFEGETQTGRYGYTVRDRWVTVSMKYGSKGGSVHEVPPGRPQITDMAKTLLYEIFMKAKLEGRL